MTVPSLRLLLSTLIDYAGVFPPAGLDLPTAIAAYEGYCHGPHRWMLGRFVLPLSQLPQFERCLDHLDQQYSAAFWPLSIVLEPSRQALDELAPWLEKQHRFTISALEFKVGHVDAIAPLIPHLPPHSDLFFEVPFNSIPLDYIAALQGTRVALKVRTGGVIPGAFPIVDALAQFIVACAGAQIPFKATAGLHHPIRSWHSLPDSLRVETHGFLNLAVAAAFAYGYGVSATDVADILKCKNTDVLNFSTQEIIYQSSPGAQVPELSPQHLPLEILAHVRSRYFLGISSCSFQEPLAELRQLGLLSENASTPSHVLSI